MGSVINIYFKEKKMALNKEQEECLARTSTGFGSRYGQLMYGDPFVGRPKEIITDELCLAVVKKNGIMLQFVPEELKTQAVCLAAVEALVYALQYVPEKQMTEAVLLAALSHHGESGPRGPTGVRQVIPYIPEKAMTVAFCLAALKTGCFTPDKVPEELREEVYTRLINKGEWAPMQQNAAVINLGALTQEGICFEFDKLSERELNSVPPNTPYRKFAVESDFVTDKIKVFVIIPDHREVPKSITLKFTNIGKTAEQQEAVINCSGRFTKAELEGIVILHAIVGRPRNGYKYRQKAEITLNFENRCEPLICPISRTTTFNMCFFDAHEAQCGKFSSFGTIYEFSD
jgi:hypothetical protein